MERFKQIIRPGVTLMFAMFVLSGGYIAAVIEAIHAGAGHGFVDIQGEWLRAIPDGAYQLFAATIMTFFGAREVGKWGDKKYPPPPSPDAEISDVQ